MDFALIPDRDLKANPFQSFRKIDSDAPSTELGKRKFRSFENISFYYTMDLSKHGQRLKHPVS